MTGLETGSGEVVTPLGDHREYKSIVISNNNLEVLLVSDKETRKCGASMSIGVGCNDDPDGLDGLTHFLEHMVFYASSKYPDECGFSGFVSQHGGNSNGHTERDYMVLTFEVNKGAFKDALDRFAQIFIGPIFSDKATEKEVKVVDAEYTNISSSDSLILEMLQRHIAIEGHPYNKFGYGNLESLLITPNNKGLNITNELEDFYKKNFCASIMRLVIYSNESLEKIEKMVNKKFKNVQNKERGRSPDFGLPFTPDHLEILVRAGHAESSSLMIVWPLSLDPNHWQEAPFLYIAYLLRQEGSGSLIRILKQLEWATSMDVETGFFFHIVINLTVAGHENAYHVLGLLFNYIDFLRIRGVKQWVFDEFSAALKHTFDFQEKIQPFDFIDNIASNMQMFPKESWLTGFFPSKFDPNLIKRVLELLSERKVRVFWLSDMFEMEMPEIEPCCGTRFSIEKLPATTIESLVCRVKRMQHQIPLPMELPVPNRYIANDLSIKTWPLAHTGFLMSETDFSLLWYKGNRFSLPKAIVKMGFNFPEIGLNLKDAVLTRIFTTMLLDSLKENGHNIEIADLQYQIEPSVPGFEVTLYGFNDKMKSLFEFIVARIATFRISRNRFLNAKEMVLGEFNSFADIQPSEQAEYCLQWILMEKEWSIEDKLDTCEGLEVEDLTTWVQTMFSNTFLRFYIAGNLDHDEAKAMVSKVENIFFKQSKPLCGCLPPFLKVTNRAAKLECGKNYYYRCSSPDQKNSALIYYLQIIPDDPDLNSRSKLFVTMAEESFFNFRADKDLAYTISLKTMNDSILRGLQFEVQSPVKAPGEIERIINAFLDDFGTALNCMTDEIFKGFVDTMVNKTLEKHKNLIDETTFFWEVIKSSICRRREFEVKALRNLNLPKMKKFYNDYVKEGASKRRTLSVRVYGSQHQSEYQSEYHSIESDDIEIDDIARFKDCHSFHDDFRGVGEIVAKKQAKSPKNFKPKHELFLDSMKRKPAKRQKENI